MSLKRNNRISVPRGTTHSRQLFELQRRLEQVSSVLSSITALLESCIERDEYWICPSLRFKRSPRSARGLSKSKSKRSRHEPQPAPPSQ
mgnify:CR=1 FL=1